MKNVAQYTVGILAAATSLSDAQFLPTKTYLVEIPTQGTPFISSVPACGTVPPYEIVGVNNGTLNPGTLTVFVPPQASAASTTYYDTWYNLTQVIIARPLPGTCGDIPLPTAAIDPNDSSDTWNSSIIACPFNNGCPAGISAAAQIIIDLLDEVSLASQNVEVVAKQFEGDFYWLSAPLKAISTALVLKFPEISILPPFPPGCDSDIITTAFTDFVDILREMLMVLTGRKDIITDFPNYVGKIIAEEMGTIMTTVDAHALMLIGLIPEHKVCIQDYKIGIDEAFDDAITTYLSCGEMCS
ncbi:hypothetical protein GQX73_g808 [Xylaria multiplex]|uniref:Uncharacterized protein n=1 Tax=Xylaria multiplex TaxID=323545 RepID=A0A7C8IX95_9PEZI|nr:hypothetical protein GQX73_g808 [Xylaria multiplex]